MKKWMMAAAVAVAGLAGTDARAQGPAVQPGPGCPNGDCGTPAAAPYAGPPAYGAYGGYGYGQGQGGKYGLFTGKFYTKGFWGGPLLSPSESLTRMPTLPVFMAAPWYNYWPYDGHFQTVAPMAHGLYYPPPTYTGNPYQPGQYPGYVPGNPNANFPVSPVK